jgi:hypothetical protein
MLQSEKYFNKIRNRLHYFYNKFDFQNLLIKFIR